MEQIAYELISAGLPYLLLAVLIWTAWALYTTARWFWRRFSTTPRDLPHTWRPPADTDSPTSSTANANPTPR